jgi:hypothetical protein
MTAALGVNNQAKETLGIIDKLKVMPMAINFITQILVLLAYGGSFFVKSLN